VKEISIFVLGFAMAGTGAAATAQDFTAGKTPAQLFSSDCAECHRSPSSVAGPNVNALAGFLREHYTTKSETADALAAYVSSFAGLAAAERKTAGARARKRRNAAGGVTPPAAASAPPRVEQ